MKIQIQAHHLLNAQSANFADVDKRFRECNDILFVIDNGVTIGIITKYDFYNKFYYNNTAPNHLAIDMANKHFISVTEDEINKSNHIMPDANEIPIIGSDGMPRYIYRRTRYPEGQRFYCNVLAGLATYNLSVNADLTVSCHCVLRKTGELGDLKTQSLTECFDSVRANQFRRLLADGCLATSKCLDCPDLVAAPNAIVEYYLRHYSLPKAIMLENTSVCNLKCKNCYNAVIEKATISLGDMEMIARQLADAGVERIALFKYGETFADKQLNEKIDVLRKFLPKAVLTTSTNGMLLDTPEALEAALKLNHVTISLDGFDEESAAKFQVGTSFERVCANIKKLVNLRDERKATAPTITWKNVLFSWNYGEGVLESVFQKAHELGVDKLQFLDGWNVKNEETTRAIHSDNFFVDYLEKYEWGYSTSGNGTYNFNMKKPIF